MMTKFLENFWDSDFNSTNGFEVLLKRMKDGREMCKALETLLKERAKAEDTFGRSLQRMAKNAAGKEEIGGLRKSWDELLSQTEAMGNSHIQLSMRMMEEAKKIEDFRESQKERRKKPEENTKKAQVLKKEWFNKVTQAKKTYENRKRELDIADENYMKQRLVLAPKEVDKLTVKKEKCLAAVEQADAQYHASVKTLDDARNDWEKQMEETCIILQAMEEERIKFLRNSMWVHTNMLSLHCVEDDQHCEESRKILEQCSEENDIRLFVAQKRTGSSRPAPIEVEGNWNIAKSTMSNGKTMPSPTSDANRRRDPHTALPSIPSNTPNPLINGARRSLPRQPDNEHFQALQHTLRSSDPLYAAVETPPPSQSNQASKYVRARYDYKAQGQSELSLSVGQILRILNTDDTNWWLAEYEGQTGHIPTQYIELCNQTEEMTII
ncbi:proline-serine-threonine phosphatase-interacting protein 1-like isoform X1 [Lytechinus variegatus]|uniref:proline-serine-threonine phosphatase-interacting protein 1-like isoform X1 n=1 Tax=Lytechinus variegatus TaxID=7654 RepID=UPI001BB19AD6|nr:proline-serine-threonine phosphatase-interacting protein 1-like isoform X1 [Lytechinus variegatus]